MNNMTCDPFIYGLSFYKVIHINKYYTPDPFVGLFSLLSTIMFHDIIVKMQQQLQHFTVEFKNKRLSYNF